MNCISLLPSFNLIPITDDYYKELLFQQVLKNKVISADSFEKLYYISKNFRITSISDTKGNCRFIVVKNKVVSTQQEKKKQLKINFSNNLMLSDACIIVDYE